MRSNVQERFKEGDSNLVQFRPHRKSEDRRRCNLCGTQYEAKSKFERFCSECKEHSELYHFHEWLPAS